MSPCKFLGLRSVRTYFRGQAPIWFKGRQIALSRHGTPAANSFNTTSRMLLSAMNTRRSKGYRSSFVIFPTVRAGLFYFAQWFRCGITSWISSGGRDSRLNGFLLRPFLGSSSDYDRFRYYCNPFFFGQQLNVLGMITTLFSSAGKALLSWTGLTKVEPASQASALPGYTGRNTWKRLQGAMTRHYKPFPGCTKC